MKCLFLVGVACSGIRLAAELAAAGAPASAALLRAIAAVISACICSMVIEPAGPGKHLGANAKILPLVVPILPMFRK